MSKIELYLLAPPAPEGGRVPYCRACAEMLGILEYYPALKGLVVLRFFEAKRQRRELAVLLGSDNHNCPILMLDDCPDILPPQVGISQGKGRLFIEGASQITRYLAATHADAFKA